MSGDLASVGQEISRGIELAKIDSNKDQIKIIIQDDQFLGKNAASNEMNCVWKVSKNGKFEFYNKS